MSPPTDSPALPFISPEQERSLVIAVGQAGVEARAAWRASPAEWKEDGSPVTAADRRAERSLVAVLRQLFPEDGVQGEEGTFHAGQSGRCWYIDPIDGTAAFVEGIPTWCMTLALRQEGRTLWGAIHQPCTGETLWGGPGGAARDGQLLPALPPAEISGRSSLFIPSTIHRHLRLGWPGKIRCLGSTALHLGLVAAGAGQAALVGPGWGLWDTAAGLALIGAVGGRASLMDGSPFDLDRDLGQPFLAGRADAVEWLSQSGRIEAW